MIFFTVFYKKTVKNNTAFLWCERSEEEERKKKKKKQQQQQQQAVRIKTILVLIIVVKALEKVLKRSEGLKGWRNLKIRRRIWIILAMRNYTTAATKHWRSALEWLGDLLPLSLQLHLFVWKLKMMPALSVRLLILCLYSNQRRKTLLQKRLGPGYDTKRYLIVRLLFWRPGGCVVLFHCHHSQVHYDLEW